ncbi:hypothetical protein Pelo_6890 [Pelomyxa schiedti]|nr:hypothetical protein Pelo_6890 [Pelomyxa schiedti]
MREKLKGWWGTDDDIDTDEDEGAELVKVRRAVLTRWLWVSTLNSFLASCLWNYAALKPLYIREYVYYGVCDDSTSSWHSSYEGTSTCPTQIFLLNFTYMFGTAVQYSCGIFVGMVFDKWGRKVTSALCCCCLPLLALYGLLTEARNLHWGAQFALMTFCYAMLSLTIGGLTLVSLSYAPSIASLYTGRQFFSPHFVNATTNAFLVASQSFTWIIAIVCNYTPLDIPGVFCIIFILIIIFLIPFIIVSTPPALRSAVDLQTPVATPERKPRLSNMECVFISILVCMVSCLVTQDSFYLGTQYELLQWEMFGDMELASKLLAISSFIWPFGFLANWLLIFVFRLGTTPAVVYLMFTGPLWTALALIRGIEGLQYFTFIIFCFYRATIPPLVFELVRELFPKQLFGSISSGAYVFAGFFLMLFALVINALVVRGQTFIPVLIVLEVGSFVSMCALLVCKYIHKRQYFPETEYLLEDTDRVPPERIT